MLKQAIELIKNRQYQQAELLLEQGLVDLSKKDQEIALQFLAKIAFSQHNVAKAEHCLQQLIEIEPSQFNYVNALIELYLKENKLHELCIVYSEYVKVSPKDSNAIFNAGYYHKQYGLFKEALAYYQQAINVGVERSEEVYLNMAVIESDHLFNDNNAITYLQDALKVNPHYVSALMNLANLYEQQGKKELCVATFNQVLTIKPDHYEALARIIDAMEHDNALAPEIVKAQNIIENQSLELSVKCDLSYSVGKAFNDCQQYDKAFHYYQLANTLNKQLVPAFNKTLHRQYIDDIIHVFSTLPVRECAIETDFKPVFICGMFRSGSTLLEQILASHDEINTSGELDFFPRYIVQKLKKYPQGVTALTESELVSLAEQFKDAVKELCKNVMYISDKRPDNFLLLGLIKRVFPQAKIIWTQRNKLDNCLSVYFLRLGIAMNYATDLNDINFYYSEQLRLKQFWQTQYKDDIITVDYDGLIKNPQQEITKVFKFLNLEWDDKCLRFFEQKNTVKTASVWQVRQPLYKSSSGRHAHYLPYLSAVIEG